MPRKTKSGKTLNSKNEVKWRYCPPGHYWRREHYQPTYTRADGTVVHGHDVSAGCCENPSKKDQIYSEELEKIASEHFSKLKGPPVANDLGFKNGNEFDDYIRGWTRFWNDVFKPRDPLDPNLVKALIASESGFRVNPKVGPYKARGLMQVTDASRSIMSETGGELKDHLVHVSEKDIIDPNFNIAEGVRWLFHKRDLASSALHRPASWDEAVANYKSILNKKDKNSLKLMDRFRKYLKELED